MSCIQAPTSAWHARPRHRHRPPFIVALLVSAATGLYARAVSAHDGGEPVDGGTNAEVGGSADVIPGAAVEGSDASAAPADGNTAFGHGGRHYETVVTAPSTATPVAREDHAAASSVITDDRTPRAAETVPELLAEQAGATVTRLGGLGATATLSLRGSAANQVLVYLDGVPLNTPTGGGVDIGAIPLGDVGRIEIYRGTTPIGFGASAIGGVVSLTTVAPKADGVALETGGGSFGTFYGGVRGAWHRDRWHFYGSARALTSDGDFAYVNNDATALTARDDLASTRRNNDLRQVDGMLRVTLALEGQRQLRVSLMAFDREQGLPGPGQLRDPDARLGSRRATGIVAYEGRHAIGQVRATAYGNYLLSHFADPNETINPVPTDARDRTHTGGVTVNGKRALLPWLSLAGVLDGRYDRFAPTDALAPGGSIATRRFAAVGVEGTAWVDALALELIGSLRLEAARETTSGRNNFYALQPTSGPVDHLLPIARLSLVETVAPWLALRANAGRYARMPSFIELYGNTGYLVGNVALRSEHGLNADAGATLSWQGERGKVAWATVAFASWTSDLIAYRIGGDRARAENVAGARIIGVESSLHVELGRHARLVASATVTDARDSSGRPTYDGNQLALRPRYRWYARPEWRAITLGADVTLGLYADLDATGGNYLDAGNIRAVEPRLLFGAGAYASLPAGLCLRVSGRNLGNAPIYDLANYPLPGREVYLTLAWSSAPQPPKD